MLRTSILLAIGALMVTSSIQAPTGTAQKCSSPVDVVLLLDASSSLGSENYLKQLQFAADLTQRFTLGADHARFGAVVFSHTAEKLFDLKDLSDHQSLSAALLAAPYLNSSTYTHLAFFFVDYDGMFEAESGGRDDAADVVILLTDGKSNRRSRTLSAAYQLKAQNVTIIAVGIGDDVSDEELESLASGKDKVFKATGFDVLDSVKSQVAEKTCEVAGSQVENGDEKDAETEDTEEDESLCLNPVDIILVMDSSSSIGGESYAKQLQFAANLTTRFQLGPLNTRFGALIFSHSFQKLFDLKDHQDSQSLRSALLATPYLNSSTYTHLAFRFVYYDGMFEAEAGGRDDAADVVILLTDGKSNRPSQTKLASQLLKEENVTIIAVGIGDDISEDELQEVASSSDDVFTVDSFDVLDSINQRVAERACIVAQGQENNGTVDEGDSDDGKEDDGTVDGEDTDAGNVDDKANGECVADTEKGCENFENGDYPACHPQCQEGYYITCSNGFRYIRDCGLGYYKTEGGALFTAKLVYDPQLNRCERKTSYCPRPLDDQVLE